MQFLVMSLLLLSIEGVYSSRCLLFNGTCVRVCPHNMHAYHTRCDRDTLTQRTCSFPYVYKLGHTCGWSRCDCNGELLLEETTGLCVEMHKCEDTARSRRRGRRLRARTRRPRLDEDEDMIYTLM